MKIELSEIEAAVSALLIRRGEIDVTKSSDLERWIVHFHLPNRGLRLGRFVLMALNGAGGRSGFRLSSGGDIHGRFCGRGRLGLQDRNALFKLLHSFEQDPDLLGLIGRWRALRPCRT